MGYKIKEIREAQKMTQEELAEKSGVSRGTISDKPRPVAEVMMVAPVREAIHRWEPRATVLNVFPGSDPSQPGTLIPAVEVEINIE